MDKGKYYNTSKKYLILLVVAILFMSVGYASINSVTMSIDGDVVAVAQDGVFITDYSYVSNVNANSEESKINNIFGTFLNTNIVLAEDSELTESSITYEITVYNSSDTDYFFEQVLDGSNGGFSDYSNISYYLENLTPGDMLYSGDYKTFKITFHYVDGVVPSSTINRLVSSLNFKFETIETLLSNIKVEVNNSGKFEDINTVLTHNLTITNNNVIPIKVNINSASTETISYVGNAVDVEVPANGGVTNPMTLKPVSGFVYLGDVSSLMVDVDLSFPCEIDLTEAQIDIDTYGSPFTEIITLYNRYDTTPNFKENINTATGSGVFKTADKTGGTAQYFRGVIDNNYVSFGGHLWRVMRVNSDGTIRLVLNTPINSSTTYYYSSDSTSTIFNGSNAETQLTTWYKSNLLTNYNSYINQKALFIHDRTDSSNTSSSANSLGTMKNWDRLFGYGNGSVSNPTINVSSFGTNSLYSKSGSGVGNGYLTYPVGLLTADEMMFAGATITGDSTANEPGSTVLNANYNYYIANDVPAGVGLWSMTPFSPTAIIVFKSQVGFFKETPKSGRLLKPVIELNSGLLFEGHGTESEPYVIYE